MLPSTSLGLFPRRVRRGQGQVSLEAARNSGADCRMPKLVQGQLDLGLQAQQRPAQGLPAGGKLLQLGGCFAPARKVLAQF